MTNGERNILAEVLQQLKDLTKKVDKLEKSLRLVATNAEVARQSQIEMQQHMALIEKRCAERMSVGGCEPAAPVPEDLPRPEGNGMKPR